MVKFKFLSPKDNLGVVKATVHKTGKMGFSTGAIKLMDLEKNKYFKLALNEEDENDKSLYLIPAQEIGKETFVTSKAGAYYYLKVKHILDELGVDYQYETVIYDIREATEDGTDCYRLTRRRVPKKKKILADG